MRTIAVLARRWPIAVIGGFALANVVVFAVAINRGNRAGGSTVVPTPNPDAPVVVMGLYGRTTDTFFLAGGRYRATWSAWGETPTDPPCTHSMELAAVDPSVLADNPVELAKSVQVPSTGTTAVLDVDNVNPGDYYLHVTSACAWQFELRPTP